MSEVRELRLALRPEQKESPAPTKGEVFYVGDQESFEQSYEEVRSEIGSLSPAAQERILEDIIEKGE